MENHVQIYGFAYYNCPYCKNAKRLCEAKNLNYTYSAVDIGIDDQGKAIKDEELINHIKEKSGVDVKTMPQIFVNGEYIGGFVDFRAYVIKNKLHG